MQIINRIEINYYRSIYSLSLNNVDDLNILVGGNDAGKSNIVKALNLFFNNQTELDSTFNFLSDLSRLREHEARSAKGRSTIWIKVLFNNYERWGSLPDRFFIKKTWTRYSEQPELTYPGNPDIPTSTISRFLNKIAFHYIPAVRSRDIFAFYLSLLHDCLMEDEKAGISNASSELMDRINLGTQSMSDEIETKLGVASAIGAPRDLRDLFRALDFSTKFHQFDVPLQKRGDGIQARHIPFILDFIARRSKKNHIWAYEEPENSLELSTAFDLAAQFAHELSKTNQIFLTTHSPAFYSISNTLSKKWYVFSRDDAKLGAPVTEIKEIDAQGTLDDAVGVSALIADRAKDLHQELQYIKDENKRLFDQIEEANAPQLIVEGQTDKEILEIVYGIMHGGDIPPYQIMVAGSAVQVVQFIKSVSNLDSDVAVPIVGLLDNDSEGSTAIEKLKQMHFVPNTRFRIINYQKLVYCGKLPKPDFITDAEQALRAAQGEAISVPTAIEQLFSSVLIHEAIDHEIISFSDILAKSKSAHYGLHVNQSAMLAQHLPPEQKYLVQKLDSQGKAAFPAWVRENATEAHLQGFDELFTALNDVIAYALME